MRISDWSSDVCSSDLRCPAGGGAPSAAALPAAVPAQALSRRRLRRLRGAGRHRVMRYALRLVPALLPLLWGGSAAALDDLAGWQGLTWGKIGRASCRERVCQYV